MTTPDFVPIVEKRFPGFTIRWEPLARWFYKISIDTQSGPGIDAQSVVVNQCKQAYFIASGVVLLGGYGFGVQAMILVRTVLELVAGVKYLISNPAMATDFLDYGKTVVYELFETLNASQQSLDLLRPEYDSIKPRFRRKGGKPNWHGERTLSELFKNVGMDYMYKTLYKEASSISHATSFVSLVRDAGGAWQQVAIPDVHEDYDDHAIEVTYGLLGDLFESASNFLGVEHRYELEEVRAVMKSWPSINK